MKKSNSKNKAKNNDTIALYLRISREDNNSDESYSIVNQKKLLTEKARELIAELMPLLKRGDPACLQFIETLRGIQGSEELVRQMENYEFVMATETFSRLFNIEYT